MSESIEDLMRIVRPVPARPIPTKSPKLSAVLARIVRFKRKVTFLMSASMFVDVDVDADVDVGTHATTRQELIIYPETGPAALSLTNN